MTVYAEQRNISLNTRSVEQGIFINSIESVVLDKEFEIGLSKFISSTVAGGILVKTRDGKNNWYPIVPANTLIFLNCIEILTSGDDWQGFSRTTVPGAEFTAYGSE